jgi:hypothetical protein
MPTLDVTDDQIVELIRQLPAERRRGIILKLAADSPERRSARQRIVEESLRKIAHSRGMNWDSMSDEERTDLVDDVIHEDR